MAKHSTDGEGELTDDRLLTTFVDQRDDAVFATLVKRYGPLVWGVCRRLLNEHDAEDAFQATFIVLARRAASIRRREILSSWLYGVARHTALRARRSAARRRGREKQVVEMPEPAAVEQDLGSEMLPLLDQELSRMPDKYRVVIILCDLEGKTRKEAARQLRMAEGTVGSRLARARSMLAKRLARHGLALSGGALAVVLSQTAAAGVPNPLLVSTIHAAATAMTGKALGAAATSVKVAALAEGVLKSMLLSKLKTTTVVLVLSAASLGIVAATHTVMSTTGPAEDLPVGNVADAKAGASGFRFDDGNGAALQGDMVPADSPFGLASPDGLTGMTGPAEPVIGGTLVDDEARPTVNSPDMAQASAEFTAAPAGKKPQQIANETP